LRLQNPDGGFPCSMVAGNPSAIHKTLTALWQLEELGLRDSREVNDAIKYLLNEQQQSGCWDEDAGLSDYGIPPWIAPGTTATRVYLTAYSAYWLGIQGYQSQPEYQSALQFLLAYQNADGKFDGYLHNTWIATSAFALAGEQYAEVVKLGLDYLSSRPMGDWDDSQIAWALDCLGAAGMTKDKPFISHGLETLLLRQDVNGRWSSEDGEGARVSATIEVLKVVKHFKLISKPPGFF